MILTIDLVIRSSKLKIYTKFQTLVPNCTVLHINYDVTLVEKFRSYIIRRQYAVQL
jgi:hypothetical protein